MKRLTLFLAVLAATTVFAAWSSDTLVDDFNGDTVVIAAADTVTSEPYRRATLMARCINNRYLDAFVVFDYLNLAYKSEVYGKFDAERPSLLDESYSQDGTTIFLRWGNSSPRTNIVRFARKLALGNKFTLRMTYYRHGRVDIAFDLTDSRMHIAKVLNACGETVDE